MALDCVKVFFNEWEASRGWKNVSVKFLGPNVVAAMAILVAVGINVAVTASLVGLIVQFTPWWYILDYIPQSCCVTHYLEQILTPKMFRHIIGALKSSLLDWAHLHDSFGRWEMGDNTKPSLALNFWKMQEKSPALFLLIYCSWWILWKCYSVSVELLGIWQWPSHSVIRH